MTEPKMRQPIYLECTPGPWRHLKTNPDALTDDDAPPLVEFKPDETPPIVVDSPPYDR